VAAQVNIRYEVWDILDTRSPFHNLTFKQYLDSFWATYNHLPTIDDLKRLYPDLLRDEIIFACDIAKWQLENE